MFSKKQRIPRVKIDQIFKNKEKVIRTDNFFVNVSENDLSYSRFAVIVSKKVAKLAVTRHFLKRKILNVLRKLEINDNKDYLVTLKKDIGDFKAGDLEKEINKAIIVKR